jgi:protease-4
VSADTNRGGGTQRARRARRRILLVALAGLVLLALAIYLRGTGGPTIAEGSTLVLDLRGQYVEAAEAPLLSRMLGDRRKPFVNLLSTLALAERDDRLATVVLRIRDLSIGWGKAQELRAAVSRLRDAGRKVIAYLEVAQLEASREYYVATAADEIYLAPGATVPLLGLAAEYLFLGGAWEKLGIEIEVERVGRYKSAVETLAGTEMSEAAREMANSLLDSLRDQLVAGIAEGRELSREQVLAAIDAGPVLPGALESLGLVDGSRSFDAIVEELGAPRVDAETYAGVDPSTVGFEPEARFALVYASGPVVVGEGDVSLRGNPVAASGTISEALRNAAEDAEIDALILRIDSPGGSSLAAELIWEATQRAREQGKPLIVSFSDLAASGGYYVAAGADAIVSPPGALTGSIGVFVLRPVIGGLLDKVGVGVETLTRGEHADLLLSSRPLSEGARERLRSLVLDTYELFVQRVADGRSLETAQVDAVGQGRVWTGAQAAERHLVDALGGLHEAVALARQKLGLDAETDVALVAFPPPPSLADQIAELVRGGVLSFPRASALALATAAPLPDWLLRMESWLSELSLDGPLLVPPLLVDVH